MHCTGAKCTARKYIELKYTAIKKTVERHYCRIVQRRGPNSVSLNAVGQSVPPTKNNAFKYTAVKCNVKKYVYVKYIVVRSTVE